MKKVCITGWGAIAPLHADAILNTDNAEFYAVCDIDEEKTKKCFDEFGVLRYSDFDKMLEDENIESVHICTPHYLHYDMITKALRAGKNVVCEKPVVMKPEEFSKLLVEPDAEKICMVFQNRLNPCVIKLKNIIESGRLGRISGVKGILTWCRTREYYEKDVWRGRVLTEGGGVLINQAIHTLDLLVYLAGNVKSVQSSMFNYSLLDIIEVEDTVVSYLKFASGAKGVFFATNAYTHNTAPQIELMFEKGIVRYEDGRLFFDGECIEEDIKSEIGKAYWGTGHKGLIKQYYEANRFININDVSNTMNTLFSIYKSAKEGKEIML